MMHSNAKIQLDYFSIPYQSLDANGIILQVNESWLELLGYSEHDVIGKPFSMFLSPDDVETFTHNYVQFKEKGSLQGIEYILVRKDGRKISVSFDGKIETDEKKQFKRSHCIFREIFIKSKNEQAAVQQNRYLSALLEINKGITTEMDLETVLLAILDNAVDLVNLDSGAIYLLNKDMLYLGATLPPLPPKFPDDLRNAKVADHPHIQKAITTRKVVFLEDSAQASLTRAERSVCDLRGLRSILYIPMVHGQKVRGVLILATVGKTRVFSGYEIDVISVMANQAAVIIENAQAVERERVSVAELEKNIEKLRKISVELEDRNSDLFLINSINMRINQGAGLREICRAISNDTKRVFKGRGAVVYLVSSDQKKLTLQNINLSSNILKDIVKWIGMPISDVTLSLEKESCYKQVFTDGKSILIQGSTQVNEVLSDFINVVEIPEKFRAGINKIIPKLSKLLNIQSVICLPLRIGKRVIGIIDISSTEKFSGYEQERLEFLAEYVSAAIARIQDHEYSQQLAVEKQLILNSTGEGILGIAKDWTHTFANPAALKMLGYQAEELIGKDSHSIWHHTKKDGSAFPVVESPNYKTMQSGETFFIEDDIFWKKDGTSFPVQYTSTPIIEKKEIVGSVISFQDITRRKRSEQALRESEEQYRSAVEDTPGLICRYLPDGTITFVNQEYCGFFGKENHQLIGSNMRDSIPVQDRESVMSIVSSLTKESPIKTSVNQNVDHAGKVHWMQWTNRALFDGDGKIINYHSFGEDITERKHAQDAAQRERENAQKYLDIAEVMIIALDTNGVITLVNQKGSAILGYGAEELIGKNWFNTCIPAANRKQSKKIFDSFLNGEDSVGEQFEQVIITRSRQERIINWHTTLLWKWERDQKYTIGLLSSGEDITESKSATEALRRYEHIVSSSTDMLALVDMHFHYLAANTSYIKAFKLTSEQLIGNTVIKVLGEENFNTVVKPYADRCLNGEVVNFQNWFDLPSHGRLYMDITYYPYYSENNEIMGFVINGRNITKHKRAETLLDTLNQASISMGISQTQDEIFKAIAGELKPLDIHCTLFPLDETHQSVFTKYIGHDSALLTASEKLVGIKHESFSFPINNVDTYREVVSEKKTLFIENTEQSVQQILPKIDRKFIARIVKLMHIQKSISAPLIVDDQVIAVFSLQSDNLTEEDVPAATAFTHELAGAWNKTRLVQDLKKTVEGTIHTIAAAVETRDPYTAGHQKRVSDLAVAIASEMHLTEQQVEGIRMAGIIHDLGKIQIPAEILSKPGILNGLEFDLIKTHPQIGFTMLKEIEFPWPLAAIILQHHEKMNGSGYPNALKGDEILIEARILAVADIVEAMSSHRPYRPALGIEKALDQIRQDRETLLDPDVVDTCLRLFKLGYKLPKN